MILGHSKILKLMALITFSDPAVKYASVSGGVTVKFCGPGSRITKTYESGALIVFYLFIYYVRKKLGFQITIYSVKKVGMSNNCTQKYYITNYY